MTADEANDTPPHGSQPLNRGFDYVETCGKRHAGQPLLRYLCEHYRHSSRAAWKARIAAGEVRLDGQDCNEDTILQPGVKLTWSRPPWREPDAPLDYSEVHVADDLLVVTKPAGLPTLPGAGFMENTLLWQVRRRYPEATPMHRLGRYTSGLVLLALSGAARSAIADDWRRGRLQKTYRALADGRPAEDRFTIDVPIGPIPYEPLGTLHAASSSGKPSETRVHVLERRKNGFLADVELITGRPHQIRIHLAAAGFPLTGDPLYGPGGVPASGVTALPGDPGYSLHAMRLHLPAPWNLSLEAPPPAELERNY